MNFFSVVLRVQSHWQCPLQDDVASDKKKRKNCQIRKERETGHIFKSGPFITYPNQRQTFFPRIHTPTTNTLLMRRVLQRARTSSSSESLTRKLTLWINSAQGTTSSSTSWAAFDLISGSPTIRAAFFNNPMLCKCPLPNQSCHGKSIFFPLFYKIFQRYVDFFF